MSQWVENNAVSCNQVNLMLWLTTVDMEDLLVWWTDSPNSSNSVAPLIMINIAGVDSKQDCLQLAENHRAQASRAGWLTDWSN